MQKEPHRSRLLWRGIYALLCLGILVFSVYAIARYIGLNGLPGASESCVPVHALEFRTHPRHPGWNGKGYQLAGGDSAVEIGHNEVFDFGVSDLSMNIWFQSTVSGGIQVIFDKRYEYETVQGFTLFTYQDHLGFQLADGLANNTSYSSSWTNYVSDTIVTDGRWHMATITLDREDTSGGKMYLDGKLILTFNPMRHPGTWDTTMPLMIGRRSSSDTGYFYGQVSSLDFFPCALTTTRIDQLYLQQSTSSFESQPTAFLVLGLWLLAGLIALGLGARRYQFKAAKAKKKRDTIL